MIKAATTRAMVLRAFPYSADGIKVEMLPAGAEADVRVSLVDGLQAEGFVAVGGSAMPVTPPIASPASLAPAAEPAPAPVAQPQPSARPDFSARGRRGQRR